MAHEADVLRDAKRIFNDLKKKSGVDDAVLDPRVIERQPIEGENVYGEAFPLEKPPRVWLEIYPEATNKEITESIREELVHIKYPRLRHGVRKYMTKAILRAMRF